jgi:hypothetical protein
VVIVMTAIPSGQTPHNEQTETGMKPEEKTRNPGAA